MKTVTLVLPLLACVQAINEINIKAPAGKSALINTNLAESSVKNGNEMFRM